MVNSKIILGINTFHTDSSACLLIDGKLIAAIEEERVNGIKECLVMANIDKKDITDIAFNTKPLSNFYPKIIHYLKNLSFRNF